jgi:cation-transporting ATPase E
MDQAALLRGTASRYVHRVTEPTPLGLSDREAAERRSRGLGNPLPPATGRTYREILRDNVLTFVNGVIFILGLALVALGQWSDALVSVGVVTVNVLVGLVQEARAKRVLDRIALLTRPRARVIRDGEERDIDPAEIVLGDVLVALPGDQFVVDGRVTGPGHMDVDESFLSGESEPIEKHEGDEVLSGSFCLGGSAAYEATRVGEASYANRLTVGARAPRRARTPLQRQVDLVVRVILFVAVSFGIILVASAIIEGQPAVEVVRVAVVVIGLVPNGLFVAIAAAYAMGAVRIAGKGALVQQTNAVESLSNVDVLCLDKTGTLTSGRLVLEEVRAFGVDESAARSVLGDVVASATVPDRTTEAIARACRGRRRTVAEEISFTSELRWSAVALADGDTRPMILGAPDVLRARLAAEDAAEVERGSTRLAARGLRVLLLARAEQPSPLRDGAGRPSLPLRLAPIALVALRDELRPQTRETLARFADLGVAIKVISGDHPETVGAIAASAGIEPAGGIVTGADIEKIDGEGLRRFAADHAIFARVSPQQKERLIQALRDDGRYVAMVGDGVNDVPSLKRADLSIALHGGTQAARAVADLVLLDDSFAALPVAFREGQRILQGMQDVLRLFLTRIVYAALLIAAAALVDAGFPYTPKQNALLTLLTVGVPTIALAALARPTPHVRERLVRSLIYFVVPAAWSLALVGLLTFVAYAAFGDPERARSTLTTFSVLCGIVLVVFAAPPTRRWTGGEENVSGWPTVVLVMGLLGAFAWVITSPERSAFFDLGALQAVDLVSVIAACAAWAIALRWIWRHQLLERALGIGPDLAAEHPAQLIGEHLEGVRHL